VISAGGADVTCTITNTLDTSAPDISIASPNAGATIARNAVVAADFACVDPAGGTGVANCAGTVADGATIDTTTLGGHGFTVTATDNAGNSANLTIAYTVVDVTAPTVMITAPADGAAYAQGQAVDAAYACADEAGGSGIGSCAGTVASGSPIDTSTAGSHTFAVDATDIAGNKLARIVTYTVSDAIGPRVRITAPADGAVYAIGEKVSARYSCADDVGGSGIGTCHGTVKSGEPVKTATPGDKAFAVTATDVAGNTVTKTVRYSVIGLELAVADRIRLRGTDAEAPATCTLRGGPLRSCRITVVAAAGRPRLLAAGTALAGDDRSRALRVRMGLTRAGRALFAGSFGYRRLRVIAHAVPVDGPALTERGSTRMVLSPHRVATPRGSFRAGDVEILGVGKRMLAELSTALGDAAAILCVGHTADLGRGITPRATAISLARARATCAFLKRLGVNARFRSVSRATSDPVATNRTPAGREHNRRVVVAVTYDG
jgi:uncharacterized UPF0146 family protein